jgi:CubicO group peptidase (beta-lactamase class C family)
MKKRACFIGVLASAMILFAAAPAKQSGLTAAQGPKQGPAIEKPETVGVSSDRLKHLDAAMQRYVDEGKLAGVLTMIARDGKTIHFKTHGYADKESATPLQKETIFRIASLTKQVTSVAIMMLFEEGRFQLDDPVSRYIPEFKNMTVYAGGTLDNIRTVKPDPELTIRHLLTLTSGLIYGEPGYGDATIVALYQKADLENPKRSLRETIQTLSRLPLAYQPGSRFTSGMQHDVLGYLVEILSGMPFGQFLAQRIFIPLGMKDTGFYVPADKLARFASMYGPDPKGGLRRIDEPRTSSFANPDRLQSGGGGLVSTAQDFMRFAQMILNGGQLEGVRLLSPMTLRLMMTNHIPTTLAPFPDNYPNEIWDLRGYGYGLGFTVLMDLPRTGSLGSMDLTYLAGGYNVFAWIDPREKLISMAWAQFEPFCFYPLNKDFQILAYQSLVESYQHR